MNFQDHEAKCRDKFARNCRIAYEFTTDPYAPYDVSTTGYGKTFNIELKDRDIDIDKYASEGYWLEKTKYDALMKAYQQTGSLPIYLNYFRNNEGIYWNLLRLDPSQIKWKRRYATKTTADGTYGEERVLKTVLFLFPYQGNRFRYE